MISFAHNKISSGSIKLPENGLNCLKSGLTSKIISLNPAKIMNVRDINH